MAEIHLQSLAHSYLEEPKKPEDYAIREMNHVWTQGGAYALLGPSGCGKSTLLNIISGLLQPSEGKVKFDGKEVNTLQPDQRNIAQVFQFPVIYDSMTVYENLAFPLRNLKYSKDKIDKKVNEVAEVLELGELLHRRANRLTADEKQKVSMGRGLVRDDVSAILFDEPLTVIDPHLKWKLRRKLKQIHEKFNITMVYVTHDQLEASTFADKIALMYQGQIVQFGEPRELFENPEHTFVGYFIGSPGMNIIEVSLEGDMAVFDGVKVPLNANMVHKVSSQKSNNIKIGIRPEFVDVKNSSDANTFPCDVLDVENLGTYKIITLQFGQQKIKARIEEDQEVPSGVAHISLPDEWLKVYVDEYLVKEETA
ncbi:ABC transporter ATP-binding protein [Sessilibacter corallicola]|uniref:ABC transporter ATP-binding protein n=1 Tax=Sessilibacter corallicola TaxID=2904075 RepID=A0ABQ0AEI9_9GAMM